jgi:hypothetical protein
MIDVEQMDSQIRGAMRFSGHSTWLFTLESESRYGDREENLNKFPSHLRQNLLLLDSTLKKLMPNDFMYLLKFDECVPILGIAYLDGWASFHIAEIVVQTTNQLSSLEHLRLNIGKILEGAKTDDYPPPPKVCNSAELFVQLTALDWAALRHDSLIALDYMQKNSPAFKNWVKHGFLRSKDKLVINVSGTK